jgi:hypothetical protein
VAERPPSETNCGKKRKIKKTKDDDRYCGTSPSIR